MQNNPHRPLPAPLLFLVCLALTLAARAQTFGNPVLGYDEQFYLLVGDRMWFHHALPYVDIFDRKPIGLFLIYAGIRALGGEGVIQYQLVAALCVAATAFAITRMTQRISTPFAGLIAAALYIVWLNFAEGEGGQAPVFYNLPMALAGWATWRAVDERRHIIARGAVAMALVGLAIQIKYTAIFEGLFFGCALLWAQRGRSKGAAGLIAPAALWITLAMLPTALALAYYWHAGALQSFLFANFRSQFGRPATALMPNITGALVIAGVLLPLAMIAWAGRGWADRNARFALGWLAAAVLGMALLGSFLSPHYAMPTFVPLTILTAPFFAGRRPALKAALVVGLFFALSQMVLAIIYAGKGGRSEATLLARAAQPSSGCLYVYDGYPALYLLTHSCLPTRWVFPGHLNIHNEDSAAALGVNPEAEEARILAARPAVIVDTDPPYALGNAHTHAQLRAALARDYRLSYRLRTGSGEYRLVYRRR